MFTLFEKVLLSVTLLTLVCNGFLIGLGAWLAFENWLLRRITKAQNVRIEKLESRLTAVENGSFAQQIREAQEYALTLARGYKVRYEEAERRIVAFLEEDSDPVHRPKEQ